MSVQGTLKLKPAYGTKPLKNSIPRPARAPLQLVRLDSKASGYLPIWLVVTFLILGALLGPMLINTQMAIVSYEMHENEKTLSALKDEQADLIFAVQQANSPQAIEIRAKKLGMVPATPPGYINLGSKTISGGTPAI